MIVPVLSGHLDRHQQSGNRSHGSRCGSRQLGIALQHTHQGYHTETDPDTEGIERTGIGIVSFTRLVGCLVQVEHNGDTGHEEEHEGDPESLNTFLPG